MTRESVPSQDESLVAYLAAITPVLFQLIGVISGGLVDVLKIDQFVSKSEFLNLANFIIMLLTLILISLSSFWDHNKFSFLKEGENGQSLPKKFWSKLKISALLAFLPWFIFVVIILNKNAFNANADLLSLMQWTSYIIAMTFTSFVIYVLVLLKFQNRRSTNLRENFTPRLIDSLRRNGHVEQPDVIVEFISPIKRVAIVKIKNRKYFINTEPTGEMTKIEKLKM